MVQVYFICPECKFEGYAPAGHKCPKCGKETIRPIDGKVIRSYHCTKCNKFFPKTIPFCRTCKIPCEPIYV